jgi:hypothetical protein
VVRYKYAVALSRTDARTAAVQELSKLFASRGGKVDGAVRVPAARLYYALAAAEAAAEPGPAAQDVAIDAARRLIEVAPDAVEASDARVLAARATGGAASAIRLLEQVPASSPTWPAARLDLVRLRAQELARLEQAGPQSAAATKASARALAADVDAVDRAVAQRRLPADPARDATLAVLRARAAAAAGDAPAVVLERVRHASAQPGLDETARRSLRELRWRALAESGRGAELFAELAAQSDTDLRQDLGLWREIWERAIASSGKDAAGLVQGAERLVALAPPDQRGAVELTAARALARAGRTQEAAAKLPTLVDRDPAWGDAWLLYARTLDATPDAARAAAAWGTIAQGVTPDSALWLEAELARAQALARAGADADRCRMLSQARGRPGASAEARARLSAASTGCAEAPR